MFDLTAVLSEAREHRSVLLVASLLLFFLGCTESTGPVLVSTDSCAGQPAAAVVSFEDANLEAAIKTALSLGVEDAVTCGLATTLPSLRANFAGITSLTGIHNLVTANELLLAGNFIEDVSPLSTLTGLDTLDLGENAITDISGLSGLTDLNALSLTLNSIEDISALGDLTGLIILNLDGNSISNIEAVRGLTNLRGLVLFSNTVADISPLASFSSLIVLDLGNNPVADLSALSSQTSLITLGLDNTLITDLGPLRNLEFIETLVLSNNPRLSDIQPLLDSPGIGVGDLVDLTATGVSCADVLALAGEGVNVISECLGE